MSAEVEQPDAVGALVDDVVALIALKGERVVDGVAIVCGDRGSMLLVFKMNRDVFPEAPPAIAAELDAEQASAIAKSLRQAATALAGPEVQA